MQKFDFPPNVKEEMLKFYVKYGKEFPDEWWENCVSSTYFIDIIRDENEGVYETMKRVGILEYYYPSSGNHGVILSDEFVKYLMEDL